MNEAKRFMRYVLPGLVFVVELFVACWLSDIEIAKEILKGSEKESWLLVAVGVLFSSGVLGYVFSTIYFTCFPLIDYSVSLKSIDKYCNRIHILKSDRRLFPPAELAALQSRDKMIAINQIWHWLRGREKGMQAIEMYTDRVSDTMHGVGATFVATLAGLISWVIIVSLKGFWSLEDVFICATWLGLAILFIVDYIKIRKYYQTFCNSSILTALSATTRINKCIPVIIEETK